MHKIRILQQVLDFTGIGGVSTEYRALAHSNLSGKYDFQSMVLKNSHKGINFKDILFYYRHIKKNNPDIIHIRGAAVDGLNAVLAAKLARRGKILVTVHGMYSDLVYIHPLKKWLSKHVIEPMIFILADGISCVCKSTQERARFKRYKNKMLPFVYNRMPQFDKSNWEVYRKQIREKYGIQQESVVGLYVGRITREKGIEVLVQAMQLLKKDWPKNFVLLCVGDGEYRLTAERALKHLGKSVIFAGSQSQVKAFYAAADFFILPSLHENHSISLLEACAAGLPSIATNCGGNPETIDDTIGLLISVGNPKTLSEAIQHMCNPHVRDVYQQTLAHKDFARFSNGAVDDRLDKVYKKILKK